MGGLTIASFADLIRSGSRNQIPEIFKPGRSTIRRCVDATEGIKENDASPGHSEKAKGVPE